MQRLSRELWRVIEPYHQLAYRSPEAVEAYSAIGVVEPQHQYFGSRLAALGPIGPKVAVAVLYGFAPSYVERAIPAVWTIAAPAAISAARAQGAGATLRRVLGDAVVDGTGTAEAAGIARAMVDALDLAGRPVAAAHAELPWPGEPVIALWHACTILREHRGDAHWAATSGEGLDPVECHVLHAADGAMPADLLQRVTNWDDAAWTAAVERLEERQLVEHTGLGPVVTTAGRVAKLRVEWATDRATLRSIGAVGAEQAERLRVLMKPWVATIVEAGVVGAWKMREELWQDLPDPE